AVPVLGDLFDFAYKANRRNLALMEQYLANERQVRRCSLGSVVLTTVVVLAALMLFLFLLFRLIRRLWNLAVVLVEAYLSVALLQLTTSFVMTSYLLLTSCAAFT